MKKSSKRSKPWDAAGLSHQADGLATDKHDAIPPQMPEDAPQRLRHQTKLQSGHYDARYQTLVETTDAGFVILDKNGNVIDANAEYVRLTGYHDLSEIRGRNVIEWTADHEKEKNAEAVRLCFEEGRIRNFQIDYGNNHRGITTVEINATVVDIDGVPQIFTLCRDITDRKKAEKALRESEERYRTVVEDQTEIICRYLPDGTYTFVNKVFCRFFGKTSKELIGRKWYSEAHPEDHPMIDDKLRSLSPANPIVVIENRVFNGAGELRWVQIVNRAFFDDKNRLVETQAVGRDITEQKRAEELLRKANRELAMATAKAEAANRAKSEFLANMSHELRTPLNAVIGFSELLLEKESSPQRRQWLEFISQRGNDLLSIIKDILDLAKIEADKMDFEDSEIDVSRIVAEVVDSCRFASREKNLSLHCQVDADIPSVLKGDGLRLKQILLNLLGNAVKFTEAGGISVTVSQHNGQLEGEVTKSIAGNAPPATGHWPLTTHLLFAITDTGIGIPAAKLSTIFDAFAQVDSSYTKKFAGVGLGLAICKRLVDKMGGRIWVESTLGTGSTFKFNLPFKREPWQA